MKKVKIFNEKSYDFYDFSLKIFDFFMFRKFFTFFSIDPENYFSELKKRVEYSFDIRNRDLSIYGVFSAC